MKLSNTDEQGRPEMATLLILSIPDARMQHKRRVLLGIRPRKSLERFIVGRRAYRRNPA